MSSIHRIGVIGAGAWGTALAKHLAEKGLETRLWAYEREVVDAINGNTRIQSFCPVSRSPITRRYRIVGGSHRAERGLLFVVPSHVARPVLRELVRSLSTPMPFISATKGVEEDTLNLMTQVMTDVLPPAMQRDIMVLSGPSFATEVSAGKPAALCLAGSNKELVKTFQSALMTPAFRVYADSDVLGVQLGGSLKNVMALAAGVVDGLDLGHNARAALITRGLAEMVRLGVAMGADPRTFYGLSGVGDLVLTCTGALSRNHTVGVRLGKGERLERILEACRPWPKVCGRRRRR